MTDEHKEQLKKALKGSPCATCDYADTLIEKVVDTLEAVNVFSYKRALESAATMFEESNRTFQGTDIARMLRALIEEK